MERLMEKHRFNHHLIPAEQSQRWSQHPPTQVSSTAPPAETSPEKQRLLSPPPHPECYTSLAPQRAVKASHPWEKQHNVPHIQKKIHPLQAQSSIMQQQALASHWKSPGLAALRGWKDAAAPSKNHAQLLTHMSYSILKSSRGKPASLLNIELSMSPKCKPPEK